MLPALALERLRLSDAELGRCGEHLAARALRKQGWSVLARRARIYGVEVDLVARRGRCTLLVEVKSGRRKGPRWSPAMRWRACDRRRLQGVARAMARGPWSDQTLGTALLEVVAPPGRRPHVAWIEGPSPLP